MTIGISSFSRQYLRSRTTDRMTDECIITHPGALRTVYNPTTRKVEAGGEDTVYEGQCRFWQVPGGSKAWDQDKQITVAQTFLSIPWDNSVEPGDIATITVSADADLVGRSVSIQAVTRGGGLRASRVMQVQFIDTEQPGDV